MIFKNLVKEIKVNIVLWLFYVFKRKPLKNKTLYIFPIFTS